MTKAGPVGFSIAATAAGSLVPTLLVAGLTAPVLTLVGEAALVVLPIAVGLARAQGRTRLWLIAVSPFSSTLLAVGAYLVRDGELGPYLLVYAAIPVLPVIVGTPLAVARSLSARIRGFGLGLATGVGPAVALYGLVCAVAAA